MLFKWAVGVGRGQLYPNHGEQATSAQQVQGNLKVQGSQLYLPSYPHLKCPRLVVQGLTGAENSASEVLLLLQLI